MAWQRRGWRKKKTALRALSVLPLTWAIVRSYPDRADIRRRPVDVRYVPLATIGTFRKDLAVVPPIRLQRVTRRPASVCVEPAIPTRRGQWRRAGARRGLGC